MNAYSYTIECCLNDESYDFFLPLRMVLWLRTNADVSGNELEESTDPPLFTTTEVGALVRIAIGTANKDDQRNVRVSLWLAPTDKRSACNTFNDSAGMVIDENNEVMVTLGELTSFKIKELSFPCKCRRAGCSARVLGWPETVIFVNWDKKNKNMTFMPTPGTPVAAMFFGPADVSGGGKYQHVFCPRSRIQYDLADPDAFPKTPKTRGEQKELEEERRKERATKRAKPNA